MKESHTEALAIIGAACRLPGDVSDLASLWTLLEEGRDAVSELPPDRFSLDRYFSQAPDLPGHAYTRAAGVIKNAKDFDADFFPLPHKESMDMDPQQRLLLEMAWETMESAGLTASSLRGSGTGVYIGASTVDSSLRGQDGPETIGMYSTIGASLAVLANRLSYVYDWHGPSQVAETACSSALVALHNACEALRAGHISLAMVGAVNLLFSPFPFICLSKAHMLSPDGRCKPFDAAANGYVRAEGGGMILVKPLEAARRDNDKVLAIIAASGINSDGRTNGLPLPNPEAQSDLLRDIYDRHRLDVGKLAYVEAHGTGTAAGDPVEALALGRVLGRRLRRRRPLYMGSIKSNVGHLEPAAGMAGLLKALLVLQKNIIPPSLHFNRPNPHIDFKGLNLKVPTCPTPLPLRGPQTLVGVNSFGFGGTNAHVVLQRAPAQRGARPRAAQLPPMPPFFLSARSAQSLSALARSLAGSLENSPDGQLENAGQPALYDTACTLIKNREHLRVRAVLVPADKENLPEALRKLASGIDSGKGKAALEAVGENCPAAFVFSGNGSQWLGMGKSMLRENAVFAAALEEVQEMLRPLGGAPIIEALQSPEKFPDQTQHTELGQPLLFAMQVGLVRALAAKGIAPGAVFGHSVGEVAAAWTAGALSLRDACAVVHFRSKLQSRFKDQGLMAVAAVSPDEASTVLEQYQGRVEITAWNAPASITLAGEAEAVTLCVRDWKQQGVTAKTLPLPYPFHTRRMEELREEFSASIASIRPQKARLPFYAAAQDPDLPFKADQAYWWRNMRQPVHFFQAARSALDNGFRLFLEIGPRPVLGGYLQEIIKDKKVTARALPSLLYSGNEAKQFEKAWQDAWKNGWPLDAKALVRAPYRPVELPVYAWDRRPHWVEPTPEFKGLLNRQRQHPLLGWAVGQLPVFENIIGLGDFPWLADHRAGDAVLLPAAAFVEIFLAAARALHPADPRELERLVLYRPIHFGKDGAMHIRVLADEDDGSLRLEGRPYMSGDKWSLFARTRMKPASRPRNARSLPAAPGPGDRLLDSAEIYARAQAHHLHYGPAFQTLQEAWLRKDDAGTEIVTRLNAPLPESAEGMHIFPTLLDGAFQALLPLLDLERGADRGAGGGEAWLPASFGNTALFSESVAVRSVARLRRVGRRSALADITLFDAEGQVSAALDGCLFRRSAWLENPGDRPAGYVMHALPRPERDQRAAPLDPDEVCRLASAPLLRASAEKEAANARTRGVTTAELLRFTALKYAHESLSALSDGPFNLRALIAEKKIRAEREAWLRRILVRLAEAGLAEAGSDNDDLWRLKPALDLPAADKLWQSALGKSPGHLPEIMLLSELTAKAGSILATAASGTGVSGSAGAATGSAALSIAALASAYFFHAPDLLPGLEALAECVRALKDAARVFEAPEILLSGLDNRELLSLMLPLVASSNIRLHVAEADEGLAKGLSAFFASSRQAAVSRLDLCRDKVPQDKAPDMIIAAFSMHAMADAPAALSNCHGSLKPGGLLCLLEHAPNTFTDLTLGAGPDWWTGKDQAGPISRLHSVGAWSEALAAAGFEEVQQAAPENKSSPAFLLLARKKAEPDSASAGLSRPENSAAAKDAAMLIIAASQSPASAELAPALVRALEDRGRRSELFYLDDPDSPAFDPLSKDCWRAFLAERASAGPLEIVWLAAYDKQPMPDGQALRLVLDMATAAPAALASAWDCMRCEVSLHLVAGGALPAGASAAPLVPSQGALWGFGRVLMNEMSGLNLSLIDLHGAPDHETKAASPGMAAAEVLARELTAPASSDREVILAADGRYSPRLTAEAHTPCKVQPANASLCLDNPGRLQNLYWRGTGAPKPGPGQVCIAVKALGLNYRDVLWSLGHLQEDALDQGFAGPGFGLEGAGIVESVGEGVSDLAPGDEVMAFLPSAFSARAVTDAALVMPMPAGMNFAEAATLPIALITAIYSLDHLAAMRPGESVLIHGAAGGVGLTAIQLARHKGLEIFATAGSSKKRDFLRRLGLKHVFSSRSLSFAPAVMEATGGKGVDAVLNSLAGDFMTAGLSVLKPMGRFLEIGKRDFFQDSSMRLNPFARNLSFFGIDVDQVIVHNRPLALDLIQRMVELCAKGAIAPLPHQSYARRQAQEAFQAMQHSAHIGKLVVGMDESLAGVRQALPAQSRLSLRKNAAYLVSGGTGGFGLATARRLAERGAGRLLLLSRRGAVTEEAVQAIEDIEALGCEVRVLKADVSNAEDLNRVLKEALTGGPALGGLVHSAAILDDGMLADLTPERFRKALAAKALGAWNLHLATLESRLDFFVLYSSATTAFGNPGSANYVAANGMLESLAARRRQLGLPATVIGWGPISDTGMLQRNDKARLMLTAVLGVSGLPSAQALDRLEYCLVNDIAASHFFGLDWNRHMNLPAASARRFEMLRSVKDAEAKDGMRPLDKVRSSPPEEALPLLVELLRKEISEILGMALERLTADTPIAEEGMDSLMGMELGMAIDQKFELDGFKVPLSSDITPNGLAALLYPVISSRGKEEDGVDRLLIDSMFRKHGVDMSDALKDDIHAAIKK